MNRFISGSFAEYIRSGRIRGVLIGACVTLSMAIAGCGGAQKPHETKVSAGSTAAAAHSEHQEQERQYGAKKSAASHHGGASECPHHQGTGERSREAKGKHGRGGHATHHRFRDAARWAKIFESKKRDAWQKGDQIVASLKLSKDARVADIGAGTGYFALRFARQLRSGVVYAVDIEKTMVNWVLKRAQRERLENLVGVVASTSSPKLPGAVDVIFVADTYHHISERPSYFARLHRKLRKGGRVVIVDFKMGKLPVGPPDWHKIPPSKIIAEMTKAGYRLSRREDKMLPYQHLFEFVPK